MKLLIIGPESERERIKQIALAAGYNEFDILDCNWQSAAMTVTMDTGVVIVGQMDPDSTEHTIRHLRIVKNAFEISFHTVTIGDPGKFPEYDIERIVGIPPQTWMEELTTELQRFRTAG